MYFTIENIGDVYARENICKWEAKIIELLGALSYFIRFCSKTKKITCGAYFSPS